MLIRECERLGGRFRLTGRSVALEWPDDMKKRGKALRLEQECRKQAYSVRAVIADREVSHKWEASGRNPHWWRDEERLLEHPNRYPEVVNDPIVKCLQERFESSVLGVVAPDSGAKEKRHEQREAIFRTQRESAARNSQ